MSGFITALMKQRKAAKKAAEMLLFFILAVY